VWLPQDYIIKQLSVTKLYGTLLMSYSLPNDISDLLHKRLLPSAVSYSHVGYATDKTSLITDTAVDMTAILLSRTECPVDGTWKGDARQ
jgi:hypothetical protein